MMSFAINEQIFDFSCQHLFNTQAFFEPIIIFGRMGILLQSVYLCFRALLVYSFLFISDVIVFI